MTPLWSEWLIVHSSIFWLKYVSSIIASSRLPRLFSLYRMSFKFVFRLSNFDCALVFRGNGPVSSATTPTAGTSTPALVAGLGGTPSSAATSTPALVADLGGTPPAAATSTPALVADLGGTPPAASSDFLPLESLSSESGVPPPSASFFGDRFSVLAAGSGVNSLTELVV